MFFSSNFNGRSEKLNFFTSSTWGHEGEKQQGPCCGRRCWRNWAVPASFGKHQHSGVCISPFCLSASSLVEEYVGQRKEYLQNLFVCNNALITWWITLLFYHVSTINARWQRLFADLGLGCVTCRVCRSWVRQRSQMIQWTNVAFPVSQIPFFLFLSMDSRSNFPQYLLFC